MYEQGKLRKLFTVKTTILQIKTIGHRFLKAFFAILQNDVLTHPSSFLITQTSLNLQTSILALNIYIYIYSTLLIYTYFAASMQEIWVTQWSSLNCFNQRNKSSNCVKENQIWICCWQDWRPWKWKCKPDFSQSGQKIKITR